LKKSLEASEWILSLSLILILASLFTITRFHEHRKKNKLIACASVAVRPVEIAISGEVAHPGVFSALPGTRIGDLVKKSCPKRFADLTGIDLDSPVEKALELAIPRLSELSVRIEGAVTAPIELKVPAGSRICDLKPKIECSGDANLQFFKKRRLLKNGEIIYVPKKEQTALQEESREGKG
jgi:SLBB domain-containing protein